jgi:hypothetical protein
METYSPKVFKRLAMISSHVCLKSINVPSLSKMTSPVVYSFPNIRMVATWILLGLCIKELLGLIGYHISVIYTTGFAKKERS